LDDLPTKEFEFTYHRPPCQQPTAKDPAADLRG